MPKDKKIVCSCGYSQGGEIKLTESGKTPEREFAIVEKEEKINPIVEMQCKKCDSMEAETWEIQTRSSDEPPTKFFKCTKCKHTWRDYK